jgi:alkanesulfonate monooxygenase SsuD/methylene tetrahydromethanopterin reductase-like flavin-dependent oxidoreductase (luciferase family)
MQLGYKLSSEEFGPRDLVELARRAEGAGFAFALISDHFHPWIDRQGQSPFSCGEYWAGSRWPPTGSLSAPV